VAHSGPACWQSSTYANRFFFDMLAAVGRIVAAVEWARAPARSRVRGMATGGESRDLGWVGLQRCPARENTLSY
jgi:hypothetical protein